MKYFILIVSLLTIDLVASAEETNNYLLYKLQSKGIISETEAQVIREQQAEEAKSIASSSSSSLTKSLNPKGDFRFRYQNDNPIGYGTNRDRVRIRLRGGIEPKITDNLKVGVGLGTGLNSNYSGNLADKDTSRSPNQTLGEGFAKKPVSLNLAYAEYTPISWTAFTVGKFNNPIWEPGDLIWDTDINPEGVALKFNGAINPNIQLFGTTDVFALGESSTASDPLMYVVQAGLKHKVVEKFSYQFGLSYYGFSDVKGKVLDGSTSTNTMIDTTSKKLKYQYKNIVAAFELNFKNPFGEVLPYLSIFAEYVTNCNTLVPSGNRNGYMLGTNFGKEKLAAFSDWQVKYNYANLAKDAILDIFPDSDRYSGKTAMWSHEITFNYALASSNYLGLDFYYGESTSGAKNPATVLQLDWNIKF